MHGHVRVSTPAGGVGQTAQGGGGSTDVWQLPPPWERSGLDGQIPSPTPLPSCLLSFSSSLPSTSAPFPSASLHNHYPLKAAR